MDFERESDKQQKTEVDRCESEHWVLLTKKKKKSAWVCQPQSLVIKFLPLPEINELHKHLQTMPESTISLRVEQKPFQSPECVLVKSNPPCS